MRYVRSAVLRYYLLNKRLFRKLSFILILCAVPVMVAAMSIISEQHGGVVTVALAQTDPDDPISSEIVADLADDASGVERFVMCDSPDEAENMVRYGRTDGAWIFESGMEERINAFADDLQPGHACVRVVEREETIALELSREKLSGIMSHYVSVALMRSFARDNAAVLDSMSDEELNGFFDQAYGADDIFEFSYLESGEPTDDVSLDIIMLPMRGLLCVTVVLAGLAVAMYYMQDEKQQTFYRLRRGERPVFAFAYQMTGVADVGVVVIAALFISGIAVSFRRELAAGVIFCFAVSAFCILVRRLCGKAERLGAVTPLLTVALIAVSPIFFSMAEIRPVQLLTPTYYYLKSIHQPVYLGYMAIYAAVVAAIDFAIYKLTDRA